MTKPKYKSIVYTAPYKNARYLCKQDENCLKKLRSIFALDAENADLRGLKTNSPSKFQG